MAPQWVKMFATTLSIPMIHMVEEENQHLSGLLTSTCVRAPLHREINEIKTKQIKVLPSPQWTKKVTHRQRGETPQVYSLLQRHACADAERGLGGTLARYCKEQRSPDHATSCMKPQLCLCLSPSAWDLRSSKASQDLAVVGWEIKWTSNEW